MEEISFDLSYHDKYECIYLNGEMIAKGARSNKRLGMIDWSCVKDKTVLDIGCNAGMFAREAARNGARKVVGIDKGNVIHLAERLALTEGLDVEWKQMAFESIEFRNLLFSGWDVVFALAVHRHYQGDKNRFIQEIDRASDNILFFETNYKTSKDSYKELLEKYTTFDLIRELGYSGDKTIVEIYPGREETDFFMFRCSRRAIPRDESCLPISEFRLDEIDAAEKIKSVYSKNGSMKTDALVNVLAENIQRNGLRIPITIHFKEGRWQLYEGAHRFLALKKIGAEYARCFFRE
jgi:SAM-dependent methyltransferase